jgi:hypothetical protein
MPAHAGDQSRRHHQQRAEGQNRQAHPARKPTSGFVVRQQSQHTRGQQWRRHNADDRSGRSHHQAFRQKHREDPAAPGAERDPYRGIA